jgi:hypothetical protein
MSDYIMRAATFDNYRPRKDKTLTLTFVTQELGPDEVAKIHSMLERYGYLVWKADADGMDPAELAAIEEMKTDDVFDRSKTPSQRLRAVLYLLWKQKPDGHPDFAEFYKSRMERIITHLKTFID